MEKPGCLLVKNFFVHAQPLSLLFRAKFRDALKQTDLFAQVPSETWTHSWVVDCRPVGTGTAALEVSGSLCLSGCH